MILKLQLAVIQALGCRTSAGQRSTHSGLRLGSDLPRPQKKRTPTPVPSTGQDEAQRLLGKKSLRWSTLIINIATPSGCNSTKITYSPSSPLFTTMERVTSWLFTKGSSHTSSTQEKRKDTNACNHVWRGRIQVPPEEKPGPTRKIFPRLPTSDVAGKGRSLPELSPTKDWFFPAFHKF